MTKQTYITKKTHNRILMQWKRDRARIMKLRKHIRECWRIVGLIKPTKPPKEKGLTKEEIKKYEETNNQI